jgi:hypothetical protein
MLIKEPFDVFELPLLCYSYKGSVPFPKASEPAKFIQISTTKHDSTQIALQVSSLCPLYLSFLPQQ